MNVFYRNRQLLFLTLTLIVVWGASAFLTLPRLEDPEIVQRNSTVTTVFPGASAERVESLVTDKIEEEFSDIEEIDNIKSTSSPNISVVNIELKDTVADVLPVRECAASWKMYLQSCLLARKTRCMKMQMFRQMPSS